MNKDARVKFTIRTTLLAGALLLAGDATPAFAQEGPGQPIYTFSFDPYTPMFTKSQEKLAETADSRFTSVLLANAVNYEPLLMNRRTQVHMGFWSGPGNHGNLVRLLDSINSGAAPCLDTRPAPNCAIWDEGATSSQQYPQYVEMLVEHWYDRGNTPAGSSTVKIYGKTYPNTNPLTFPAADRVWGQYSQRYADMARTFARATGKPVKAWCFVQGAGATRIFYVYEYPELQRLERERVVTVYCARKADADWRNPADWSIGTGSAACPAPTAPTVRAVPVDRLINVNNR